MVLQRESGDINRFLRDEQSSRAITLSQLKLHAKDAEGIIVGEVKQGLQHISLENLLNGNPDYTGPDLGSHASVILTAGTEEHPVLYRVDPDNRISKLYKEHGAWKAEFGFASYFPALNTQTEISTDGEAVILPVGRPFSLIGSLLSLVSSQERELNLGPLRSVITVYSTSAANVRESDSLSPYQTPFNAPTWFFNPRLDRALQQSKKPQLLAPAA